MRKINIDKFISVFGEQYNFPEIEKIKPVLKDTVHLYREPNADENIPVGTSKFGGSPDLPKGMKYPYYSEEVAYSFIMQLDCSILKTYDKSNKLPKEGMLYLFHAYEYESIVLPFDVEGDLDAFLRSTHIFHYNGSMDNLERTKLPNNEHIEVIESASISFVTGYTIPEPVWHEELYMELGFIKDHTNYVLNDFYKALPRLVFEKEEDVLNNDLYRFYDKPHHQILGTPTSYQGDPGYEVVVDHKNLFNISTTQEEWILLFQIWDDDDIKLTWAAPGYMYYYIKKEDLTAGNWKDIYSVMECS
ncbi:YwqG family protein [Bacillus luti]|nr:hypothetical protein BC2903_30180 [Bacillus cereus]